MSSQPSAPIEPKDLMDLDFRIQKLNWSLYDVAHSKVSGTLRILGVPTNIFEIDPQKVPPGTPIPAIAFQVTGVVSFKNEGDKKEPGPVLSPAQFQSAKKEDITSFIEPREEPFNEFVASRKGSGPILVRMRTTATKVELLEDKVGPLGDPLLWVSHATTHSAADYPKGNLLAC